MVCGDRGVDDIAVGLESTCGRAVDTDAAVAVCLGSKERTVVCAREGDRGGGFDAVSDRTGNCDSSDCGGDASKCHVMEERGGGGTDQQE